MPTSSSSTHRLDGASNGHDADMLNLQMWREQLAQEAMNNGTSDIVGEGTSTSWTTAPPFNNLPTAQAYFLPSGFADTAGNNASRGGSYQEPGIMLNEVDGRDASVTWSRGPATVLDASAFDSRPSFGFAHSPLVCCITSLTDTSLAPRLGPTQHVHRNANLYRGENGHGHSRVANYPSYAYTNLEAMNPRSVAGPSAVSMRHPAPCFAPTLAYDHRQHSDTRLDHIINPGFPAVPPRPPHYASLSSGQFPSWDLSQLPQLHRMYQPMSSTDRQYPQNFDQPSMMAPSTRRASPHFADSPESDLQSAADTTPPPAAFPTLPTASSRRYDPWWGAEPSAAATLAPPRDWSYDRNASRSRVERRSARPFRPYHVAESTPVAEAHSASAERVQPVPARAARKPKQLAPDQNPLNQIRCQMPRMGQMLTVSPSISDATTDDMPSVSTAGTPQAPAFEECGEMIDAELVAKHLRKHVQADGPMCRWGGRCSHVVAASNLNGDFVRHVKNRHMKLLNLCGLCGEYLTRGQKERHGCAEVKRGFKMSKRETV
ncbi:unnamed protein product [Mycena citricolor]|uniref:Uncharacterized protein n=1 Tax=Mycena citricolor TaxID=2018698 RepID=A0AAD2HK48_9AGAR|nr:unnamed protein product [Mycena citricolor]